MRAGAEAGFGSKITLSCAGNAPVNPVASTANGVNIPDPLINGVPADWCPTWGVNCGQAGADLYCQTAGYGRASRWGQYLTDRTYVIGSKSYCEMRGTCGALRDVVCTR